MTTTAPQQTFIYEQTEVRLTGRTARNTRSSGKVDILHEITPVDTIDGTWKKWVIVDRLHQVDQ